jgi:hydrogenase-4 membrane subunit HyfE
MNHFSMMVIVASGAVMLASLLVVDTASTMECIKDSHTVSLITEISFFTFRNNPSFLDINL